MEVSPIAIVDELVELVFGSKGFELDTGGFEGMKKNADGSYDVYSAPQAPKGQEGNGLQTMPGKSGFVIPRIRGPLESGSTSPGGRARSNG